MAATYLMSERHNASLRKQAADFVRDANLRERDVIELRLQIEDQAAEIYRLRIAAGERDEQDC